MIEEFLEHLGFAEWIADAVSDSLMLVPFLFVIFVLIELFEFYYADKVKRFVRYTKDGGPVIGSFVSLIPQCGFSVIASTLYVRKYLSMGTLIAIYLATSDEALPVLLADPGQYKYILPVIMVKLLVAIPAGYIIDLVYKPELREVAEPERTEAAEAQGCCRHDVVSPSKKQLILHPLKHTLNIFLFILGITLLLNYLIDEEKIVGFYQNGVFLYKVVQPVITALIGLIPNCAVSIAITVMLIKGTISFGAAMAGLLSNAGLGLLVLLRGNRAKNNLKIVIILLVISIICGEILQIFPIFDRFMALPLVHF